VDVQSRVVAPVEVETEVSVSIKDKPDTQGKIEKPNLPTAVRAEVVSTQAVSSAPSILSAPIGSDQEKTVVEAKPVDTQSQVVAPVEEAAQPANKVSEKIEVSHATKTELKIDDGQSVMSLDANQTTNKVQTGSANQKDIMDEVSVSVAVQADAVAGQAKRTNEKTPVVEIYQESKQDSDPIVVINGSVNETVVVKAAEKWSATQVNVQASEVVQQIMSQMKVKIKSEATSMHLQLNPKELGVIEVQMTRNAEGVSVTFFAEQASTGKLLETQINQLRQSLKDAGVQLTGLNISQHDQPKQEGGFLKQGSYFGQYFQRSAPQIETVNKERERLERIGRSSTEVDYLI
jgi:flagellar hook-length control protein FliK